PAAPAPAPVTAATIVQPEHLVATLRLAAGTPAAEPAAAARREVRLDLPEPPPEVIRYVAVATGRGRRSAPSAVVEVPIGRRPTAPVGVRATFDDTNIIVEWAGATPAVPAHVDELVADGIAWTRTRRTPEALAASRFTTPLVFGEHRCFEVRHVLVAGRALVEGPASSPACVAPVDRFPPPVPGGLVAIAEDGAVVLTWRAVEAADLSGYLVLRGDGAGETLQPLTPLPIEVRTYRDETVRAGETYTYAIVAVDRSTPANRSAESNRQTVMARQARFR
ncbi:MAG TPA: hypothetical protein VMM93_09020, partial [Vicinamibacterales bacterium]|nr:hypothetical protein [Vicinamibacterales bacterium]